MACPAAALPGFLGCWGSEPEGGPTSTTQGGKLGRSAHRLRPGGECKQSLRVCVCVCAELKLCNRHRPEMTPKCAQPFVEHTTH